MKKIKKITDSRYFAVKKFEEIEKGTLTEKSTYKYDEKGNKIEQNYYYVEGKRSKFTYKYEFDAVGNWIKKTGSGDGEPIYIRERVIEYY